MHWDTVERGSYVNDDVPDVGDELCTVPLSNAVILVAGIVYVSLSLNSILVDLTPLYDIIGVTTVLVVVCALVPFTGKNSTSTVNVFAILTWIFIHYISAIAQWNEEDRRFSDGLNEDRFYRFLLFAGQGLQIWLLLKLQVDMLHDQNHKRRPADRANWWHFLSKLLAFAVTNIGLVLLAASSHSRLTNKTTGGVRNVNYAAEMMVWTGLSINALNSGAVETKTQLCFVLAPVSFLVPCISFK